MSDPSPPASENLLAVNESLSIPRSELDVRVSRASGAGGQHVNKTSSRVEIFWNIAASRALSDEQRARLLDKLSSRLTTEGSIRVVASDMRSQSRNRDFAEERLAETRATRAGSSPEAKADQAHARGEGSETRIQEAALEQEAEAPGPIVRLTRD